MLKNIKLILFWGLILAFLSFVIALLSPKQYSAVGQVLIISRDRTGVDPYTQSKSAEKSGENLAEVVKTSDFFNKVMLNQNYDLDRDYWQALGEKKRRKEWEKDVQISLVYGTSILNIKTYSKDKDMAVNLNKAVSDSVSAYGWEYLGGDVVIKPVSSPIASSLPARPDFLANTAIGFALGALLGMFWVIKYKKARLF